MDIKFEKYHFYAIGQTADNKEVLQWGNFRFNGIPKNDDIEPTIHLLLQQEAEKKNLTIEDYKFMIMRGYKTKDEKPEQLFQFLRGWGNEM